MEPRGIAMEDELAQAWHAHRGRLARFVADLVATEIARLRPGGPALRPPPWPEDLSVDEGGLGLDSLERLAVAAALAEALDLQNEHEKPTGLWYLQRRFGDWLDGLQTELAEGGQRLAFRTSGSTGQPKLCTHQLADLEREVDCLASLLAGRSRVLSAVPAHHIYGFLFGVLLPRRLGAEAIDVRAVLPSALAGRLQPGDLLVSHPHQWALVARFAEALPSGVWGSTSTAPCPDTLTQCLAERGLERLLQIYGSTETAGVGWRDRAGQPFRLFPFWCRSEAAEGTLQRRSGPFRGNVLAEADVGCHTVELQDRLTWRDSRHFDVHGRLDAAVQVGGVNVYPQRVREALLRHPDVNEATVRLMAPHEGERLKAFVVPRPGVDGIALRANLHVWAEVELSAPERPKAFNVGARLPIDGRGKAIDWSIDDGVDRTPS